MSVSQSKNQQIDLSSEKRQRRRSLSPEKKFQIFLESQTGKTPVGEDHPGAKRKTIPLDDYEALKRDLEEKERALAEQAVELAILRKKTNGGSWER